MCLLQGAGKLALVWVSRPTMNGVRMDLGTAPSAVTHQSGVAQGCPW